MVPRRLLTCAWVVAAFMPGLSLLRAADEASQNEPPITERDRQHWAFRPLNRPALPMVDDVAWPRNPIDRFILARLEASGLSPMPTADRVTLIRRVTYDLHGLPPTPDEVDRFVNNPDRYAYEALVDRLLASPRYGVRWGQHWLDLARFAETDGFEHDKERPNAWRYRDWVIDALNRDLPYDEFVRLQIAADEIRPDRPEDVVATGFTLCGPDMSDINEVAERRHMVLNDMTATVGSVFLGLQVGCAQCHDHKFDPISQADFYRLRSFFEPTELFREQPLLPANQAEEWKSQTESLESRKKAIAQRLAKLETTAKQRLELQGDRRTTEPDAKAILTTLSAAEQQEFLELRATQNRLDAAELHDVPHGRVLHSADAKPGPFHLRVRGDFHRLGPEVRPGFPRIVDASLTDIRDPSKASQPGSRRTALARWLTRPDHPLTTRVIANRVWQFHFGRGLVRSPSDFGRMGEQPTHPDLLDWLATELPQLGWNLKRFHKLILTSATYQQASRASTPHGDDADRLRQARERDPENRLLARQNRRRLEAEAIRDALLMVSGRLSQRQGGRGVMPPLPREIRNQIRKDHWRVSPDVEDHHRRSVYLFVRRNLRYPLFEVFDRPDTNASCARRDESTIAPQSLALLNSDLSFECARRLAGLALSATGSDHGAQVRYVYRRALGRLPHADEEQLASEYLGEQADALRAQGRPDSELAVPDPRPDNVDPYEAAALSGLCLSILNLNEFIYVD